MFYQNFKIKPDFGWNGFYQRINFAVFFVLLKTGLPIERPEFLIDLENKAAENEPHRLLMNQWVDAYGRDLLKWAILRVSSKEIAEDLVQDSLLAAFQQLVKFEGNSSPKTWLMAILKNKIADHYRENFKKGPGSTFQQTYFQENDTWKTEEMPVFWEVNEKSDWQHHPEFSKVLDQCLGNLNENWRQVLLSKFIDEKDGKSICQEMGIQPTNYWQILHRAKSQMRKCLELNWFNT